jgi:hypothetical protein
MRTWRRYLLGGGIAAAAVGSGFGYWYWRRRRYDKRGTHTEY